MLTQAIAYLTKATGKRPVGYRAPSWAFSPNTLSQILKAGFLYDSSFMAMDEPYELVQHGKPTGLIELPIEWILDDFPYYSGNASGSLPSPVWPPKTIISRPVQAAPWKASRAPGAPVVVMGLQVSATGGGGA